MDNNENISTSSTPLAPLTPLSSPRILLCEDDENLGPLLQEYLSAKGYETELCPDGVAGYQAFQRAPFNLCLLDVMMPKKDGFALAEDIRALSPVVPVIFLTARTLKEDVLRGFGLGADDYITKPFSMEELVVRIEAVLRRSVGHGVVEQKQWQLGSMSYDAERQTLTFADGSSDRLTLKENELLRIFCRHIGEITPRDYALKMVWTDDNYFNARSMDVYVSKLRKHLSADKGVRLLNVHGRGYRLLLPGMPGPDGE